MSTDIAIPVDEPNGLAVWAQGAREVEKLAAHVAQSALVPQAYRGKPVDVLACWLTGQEVGIPPMASLRSIDVIQGTPGLRAHAMRGLVQSRGHDIEIVECDDQHCVVRGRRKGSEAWQEVMWDLDRARRMKLTDREQWKTQPRTMLIARATGEICRLVAADVLYAVPYASEELGDEQPLRATASVDRPKPASLAQIVGETTGVYPEPIDIGDAPVVPAPEPMTAAQGRKLYALLRETNREGKEDALHYLTLLLGRPVASTKELSKGEANVAIDALDKEAAAETGITDSQPADEEPELPL